MDTQIDGDAVVVAYLETHGRELERALTVFTRDPEEAADLVQEVALRLLLEVRAGRRPERPAAWAMTVGRNLAISRARRRQTAGRSLDRLPQPDPLPSPEATVLDQERDQALERALAEVSSTDRRAVVLAASGYRGREIAADLGRTELATRALLCRARSRLRARLDPTLGLTF
ncbi:MAG TPA: sigma-70 family RNA polymerase sigma factor [Patescibacteria group bacterium]|nr:sigma-70 family RNA polymerase sigma factor [Patescibacteria group bacterium]